MRVKAPERKTMAAPAGVSMLLLRNVPLFSALPEQQLVLLTSAVSRRSFTRGTTIISAGDVTESLYVVVSGRLKVMTKKLAKQDIAKMIGASREMVSRVMKDLQSGGFIEVRPGSIFLHETILTID